MTIPAGSFSTNNQAVRATGGNVTLISGDGEKQNSKTVHTYLSGSSSFIVQKGILPIEYLVVAGGGAGGWVRPTASDRRSAGGGGAGGYRSSVQGDQSGEASSAELPISLAPGSYPVVVGAGGVAALDQTRPGQNSSFGEIVSFGGGAGGVSNGSHFGDFGSGGGAGQGDTVLALGIPGQGTQGGARRFVSSSRSGGGGGGGAGQPGLDAFDVGGTATENRSAGGAGGAGLDSFISQDSVKRGGGGGGGGVGPRGTAGQGGAGGGGRGGQNGDNGNLEALPGSPNTGGGGGGAGSGFSANRVGGSGGSGIVIIRYDR